MLLHLAEVLARWTLTVLSLLLLVAWAVSLRWTIFRMAQFGDSVSLKSGTVVYLWTSDPLRQQLSGRFAMLQETRWEWHTRPRATPMEWSFFRSSTAGRSIIAVPLWQPWLIVTLSGALLWWRRWARRARPGHCPCCRYDVRGLPSGVPCPECGSLTGIGEATGIPGASDGSSCR
ncbi:MAG: hypothetical protein WD749_13505 [Phycisphaerales bacterium]